MELISSFIDYDDDNNQDLNEKENKIKKLYKEIPVVKK